MKKRILVVEDEKDIADLVKLVLETQDYEVKTILDPESAVKTIREFNPDAILLDLLMPKLDGWEVFKIIREDEQFAGIPIAILTAKSAGFDEMVGLHVMKADAYITKPFGKQELLDKTDELLKKSGKQ
ncbi:MAG: response regulator [Chitinivibrionales bacterium]|nr:response regulator [Chitinivibrionales bacterium]